MLEKIFDIEKFNIISDEDNYYFFRALNMADNNDIDNKTNLDENGKISRIRTDRERYEGTPKYDETSNLSLEEVFNHVKMHHRTDTNCISLTSNANAAVMYGRGSYKDKYVMVKVPKSELGSKVINAGLYMMEEIQKEIEDYITNNEIDDLTKYYLDAIDNVTSEQSLDRILSTLKEKREETPTSEMFQKGITYDFTNTTSLNYQALNERQNLEKNKMIAKLDILKHNILPNVANKFLIQTLGNAFSSLELIHYKDIEQEEIIELPKEIVDSLSLIQQLPEELDYIEELKQELITYLNKENKTAIESFKYRNYHLIEEDDYTIEKMYDLTDGNVSFFDAINLYKKSFYLAKSKLRAEQTYNVINLITENNPKYQDILEYLKNSTYGVEPEIFSRITSNKLNVSESVNLDFTPQERELFDYINNLSTTDLNYIMEHPATTMQNLLKQFLKIENESIDEETYYANAIIDVFDWRKIGVVNFENRSDIVDKLKEKNVVEVYRTLKEKGIKEKDIANVLLTTIIKEKALEDIDLKDKFTIEELEDFLGYYKIKDTELKLRKYQEPILENIDKTLEEKQFVSVILPTGAGKSFVALAEMLEHTDEEILYLAPSDEILNQIENYIIKYVCGKQGISVKGKKELIKEKFPHLKLQTYSSLLSFNQQEIIEHKYNLIIFDELHRTGAEEWHSHILKLLENQDKTCKILGITATPQRDMDDKNMADEWAKYFGYTEKEIILHKHLAINMSLKEAIGLGYVVNPKLVSCEYTLKDENGLLDNLSEKINLVTDEEEKTKLLTKFDYLRRRVEQADGIEKILKDNVKQGGKYIVFCPIINKDGKLLEDEDESDKNYKLSSEEVIEKYKHQLAEYLKEYNLEFYSMLGKYSKSINSTELKHFEKEESGKTKFMVVMNKLNEGVHVNNIDGIIWFRPLDENSNILFHQQLGRIIYSMEPNNPVPDEKRPIAIDLVNNVLRVNLKNNKKTETKTNDLDKLLMIVDWMRLHQGKIPDLNSYDRVEANYGSSLKKIQTKYSKYLENKELLETLSEKEQEKTRTIINLGNDINLWNEEFPEKIRKDKNSQDKELELFELTGILKDYYELDKEIDPEIDSWNQNYELAKAYYEKFGNLKIPQNFKTLNGIEKSEDENAIALGSWISRQRVAYNSNGSIEITEDKIQKLEDIGMIWKNVDDYKWNQNYELAKAYYEKFGNLLIPASFKTLNGIEGTEDENAIALGTWIVTQRRTYNGNGSNKITEDKIQKLENIGMIWENVDDYEWNQNYELAKAYYEKFRNLKISQSFKTLNGIEKSEDENAIALGRWISKQRKAYNGKGNNKITEDKIQKLENIGMIWENVDDYEWNQNYELAKAYYEKFGNLKIPQSFKTLNGIKKSKDENAIALGIWIANQRSAYNGKGSNKITEDKIQKLENIGMIWENVDDYEWNQNYELAKAYYEKFGNLKIPASFKTLNGIEKSEDENAIALGTWIVTQRRAYNGKVSFKIKEDKIQKLEDIGMIWDVQKNKFINQEITSKNTNKTKQELLERFKVVLEDINSNGGNINTKEAVDNINQAFNDSLGFKK